MDKVTPEKVYLSRRKLLKDLGLATGAAAVAFALGDWRTGPRRPEVATAYEMATGYNNFYEFSISKDHTRVKSRVFLFKPRPWTITVGGLVEKPLTLGIEDVLRLFPTEQRVYRMRCVEGWSMVIPWDGFPLAALLKLVSPLSSARFVRFESVMRPEEMPTQNDPNFPWPYVEALRLDEAMHPLTLLSTGMYGQPLLPQSGAPIRLVVPWKYGFKSIKSIARIDLVEEAPATFWYTVNPAAYGFFGNVNPEVSHPVWSQSSEHRIGETGRRPTLMFNGYEREVVHLYRGLDLRQWW